MRNSAPGPRGFWRLLLLLGLVGLGVPVQAAGAGAPVLQRVLLPHDVHKALAGSGLPLASFGVHVQAVDSPRAVAMLNAESPYVLASTANFVTALAALDLLGPQYRWRTHAFANGQLHEGRLLGDLLIAGGGNARLSSAELLSWFRTMRAQGLADVAGDILIDRSAFRLSEEDHRHTPVPGPGRPHHVWPAALTLDQGVLHVQLQPSRGASADVQTMPPLAGVPLVNKVAYTPKPGGGCVAGARWQQNKAGEQQLVVEGRWSAGCGTRDLAVIPPLEADYVPHAIAGLWAQAGGRLGGRVRLVDLTGGDQQRIRMPTSERDGAPLLPWSTHLSEPLPVLVREMNKSSNNLAARHLMLSLARGFPLKAASLASAQQSVQHWLQRQGLAGDDIALENGSGLSREERGKPRAMVQLLLNAWQSKEARTFFDSLPVAGVDGTLQHRMQRGLAAGRAYLKTGTLLDARALAGYVQGASGRFYAVAALVNHPNAARATPALDALIEWVAKNG